MSNVYCRAMSVLGCQPAALKIRKSCTQDCCDGENCISWFDKQFSRLAAYEDTGKSPEEIISCGRNQYTSKDEAEGCICCVYKGPLELMGPAGVEKTGEEVDEQLIKLLQSDKYQKLLKRIESSPKMPIERWTGDEREIICPACKSYICYPEDIKTIDLKYRQFCGACGQKLNWESEAKKDD